MRDPLHADGFATTQGKHPAPFTASIITSLAALIPLHVAPHRGIHDPFGGEGVRLGELCDAIGYRFSGTDLEPWRDGDRRVTLGDSTDPASYPSWPFAVVTSPTYNNGVNDHFRPSDTSHRLTYRVAAGHELHPNNTGRWSGRGSKRSEAEYWRLTREVVKHWPDVALVNVKDSTRAGDVCTRSAVSGLSCSSSTATRSIRRKSVVLAGALERTARSGRIPNPSSSLAAKWSGRDA